MREVGVQRGCLGSEKGDPFLGLGEMRTENELLVRLIRWA